MQKLPLIGDYFIHEIPPSDDVSVPVFALSGVGGVLMVCGIAFLSVKLVRECEDNDGSWKIRIMYYIH